MINIIDIYVKNNVKNIYLLGGYKFKELEEYCKKNKNLNLIPIYSGLNTNTGGRLLKLKNILKNKYFFLTYGDSLTNFNPKKSINYINKNPNNLVISSYNYLISYGVLIKKKEYLNKILEKKHTVKINAGFYNLNYKIFKYIKFKNDSFEIDILPKLIKKNIKIKEIPITFWHPVDTISDKKSFEELLKKNSKIVN